MNKRQKLVQKQFLDNEEAVIKRLNQVYSKSLTDINDKIKNLTFTIDKLQREYDWMEPDDPERAKIKSKIQSKIYQKNYQQQLQKQVDGILKQMQTQSYLTISDYLDGCYTDGFIGSIFDLHGQGVPIISPIDQSAMVRAVQLESKISKGLYTRLGEDVNLLKKKITAQVSRSIATGMTYAQTAKQLENYTRIGYNNSIRIARTEGHRIQTTATMDAMESAKEKGADVVKQWDATLDGRTRESHSQIDGEIRELDEPFSNGLMYPGDPDGDAAEVVNCRCALLQRARWALDEDELQTLKDRAAFYGLDKSDQFDDFKKQYLKVVENAESVIPILKETIDPVTLNMFPEAFRKNKQGKNASQTFADALNEAEGLNPNIRKLYTSMDELSGLPDYKVSYTARDHALQTVRFFDGHVESTLKIPKMTGDDLMGEKCTAFHEMGHFIDMGCGDNYRLLTKTHQKLTNTVMTSGWSMSDDTKNLLDKFQSEYKKMSDDITERYRTYRKALSDDVKAGKIPYREYSKKWDASFREQNTELDYLARNLCGGGVTGLSDIYDALSGGSYLDSGQLLYGHGGKYYSSAEKRNSEIFANYMSLSVNRPDLIEMLRKDKPDLCKVLDEVIEEMAGGIK